MELASNLLLYVHNFIGVCALVFGFLAMTARKGRRKHRLAGKAFYTTVLVIGISTLVLAYLNQHMYLIYVAVFALFQDYHGFRATRNKKLRPNILDWLMIVVALANGVFMLRSENAVLSIMALFLFFVTIQQLRQYGKVLFNIQIKKQQWLAQHIGMMIGAYMAVITDLLLVNWGENPKIEVSAFMWIMPLLIFSPIIIYWTRKFT